MSEVEVRVVVVSSEPAAVVNLLGRKLTGYLPVAVPSVEKVAQKLRPDAIILLDLDDATAGIAAARRLRNDGFREGIVLIGTTAVGGLRGVVGLKPPFRLTELVTALEQASRQQSHDGTVGGAQPPDPPVPGRDRVVAPIGETDDPSQPTAAAGQPPPSTEDATPLRRGPTEAVPDLAKHAVASADPGLLTGRQPPHPAAAASGPVSDAPVRATLARWRQRLSGGVIADPAAFTQREMHERLVMMLAATSQLEVMAEELPVLTNRMALCEGIVEAVANEFEADTVGFWEPDPDGWVVTVSYGFTDREVRVPAGSDQPVLRDIDANGGAILLEPVARFQPLVRGIGGAHTESFMAAAVAVGGQHFGILALGRDRSLFESDLDRLIEIASESAVVIGVAEHLERMHSLVERSRAESIVDLSDLGLPQEKPAEAAESIEHDSSREDGSVDTDEAHAGGAVIWPSSSTASGEAPQPGLGSGPPDLSGSVIDLSDRASGRR